MVDDVISGKIDECSSTLIQCMDQDNVSTASPMPVLPLVQDALPQVSAPNMRSVAVSVRMKGKNEGIVKCDSFGYIFTHVLFSNRNCETQIH